MDSHVNYQAVVVDCVNVCLEDGQANAMPALERILGVPTSDIEKALGGDLRAAYTTRRLTAEQYWDTVIMDILRLSKSGVIERIASARGVTAEDVGSLGSLETVINEHYKPIPKVIDVLERLEKIYLLGMISNTSFERSTYWQANFPGIFRLFGHRVLFSNLPPYVRKHQGLKEMLNLMSVHMNLPVGSMIYVDDKSLNVEAAIDAGVGGSIHLTTTPQLPLASTQQELALPSSRIVAATYDTFESVLKESYQLKL
ncbi:hypothetical protein HYV83_01990 [Candidatus Woesearchaeota archaeon]|nr:hypothetical protein [Candidatus Woesearchaeota archaeon]